MCVCGVVLRTVLRTEEVWWILVGTHSGLEDPDLHFQFRMTLEELVLHDLSVCVRHVHNFLAIDMSPDLAVCSNVTTFV